MHRTVLHRRLAAGLCCIALLVLTACGAATLPPGDSIADRDEMQNRAAHQFNVALDRTVIEPVSRGFGTVVPRPVRQGIGNAASNLAQPSYILNNIVQVRLGQAVHNTLRFVVNSTVGLGGLLDPATALGLEVRPTNFGETMHIYGAPEGDFIMLPVLGPSTTRDTMGTVVDIAINPLRWVGSTPERQFVGGTRVLSGLGSRYDNRGTIDPLLYQSADSYSQLRSLYLQNRRFQLGRRTTPPGAAAANGGPVPPADAVPAAAPSFDLYADPYVDANSP